MSKEKISKITEDYSLLYLLLVSVVVFVLLIAWFEHDEYRDNLYVDKEKFVSWVEISPTPDCYQSKAWEITQEGSPLRLKQLKNIKKACETEAIILAQREIALEQQKMIEGAIR